MKRILLLDESGIFIRNAFGGAKDLSLTNGKCIGGCYGSINTVLSIVEFIKPDYIISCADSSRNKLERKKKWTLYKENRNQRKGPEIKDYRFQKDSFKAFLKTFKIPRILKEGFEADDVIASLTELFKKEYEVYIASGDKDMLQLLDKKHIVKIILVGKYDSNDNPIIIDDTDEAKTTLGVHPDYCEDLQALIGDTADNYPGAIGVGTKTGEKLINKYSTLDNIYKNLDDPDFFKTKKGEYNKVYKALVHEFTEEELKSFELPEESNIKTAKDLIYLCKELAHLERNLEFSEELLISYYRELNRKELKDFFEQLEFETFILRLNL